MRARPRSCRRRAEPRNNRALRQHPVTALTSGFADATSAPVNSTSNTVVPHATRSRARMRGHEGARHDRRRPVHARAVRVDRPRSDGRHADAARARADNGRKDETSDDRESGAAPAESGANFCLDADRELAHGWPARAHDNIAAIRLSKELESTGRAPTPAEQARLIRFIGFGATELAQNCFPLPGKTEFRAGWEEIVRELAAAVTPEEYAALRRATQRMQARPSAA